MKSKSFNVNCLTVSLALGLMVFSWGCAKGGDAPEVPPAATPTAQEGQVAPDVAVSETDRFPVPEGTPEEMLDFLKSLQSEQPAARDPESVNVFIRQLGQAVVTASDRILAAKPSEDQAREAVQYKLAGLGLLDQIGDTTVAAKRAAMPAELEAAGFGSFVRIVDRDGLISRFQKLRMGTREDLVSLAEDLAVFLEKSPPEPQDAGLAMEVAGGMENGVMEGVIEPEQAAVAYERYGKVLAKVEDEQIAELATTMIGAARRLRLVGNEMPLEGLTVDGKEFQWDQYRGKVVLVDFWATWCRPCLDEMVSIRENYDKYHDRGFDVVGISIDESRGALVSFLKNNELPWTVLVDEDLKKADREAMSTRYGVFGIPNVTLVGKDGKVVAVDTRGPELGKRLAELLGDSAASATPAKTSDDSVAKESDEPKAENN